MDKLDLTPMTPRRWPNIVFLTEDEDEVQPEELPAMDAVEAMQFLAVALEHALAEARQQAEASPAVSVSFEMD